MRTIHALFAFVLVFSIVAMNCQIAVAEHEPVREAEAGKPCADEGAGEKVVEIPLKEIWAHAMVGTSNVEELEPERFASEAKNSDAAKYFELVTGSLVFKIRSALKLRSGAKQLGTGFIVIGKDLAALQSAAKQFPERTKSAKNLQKPEKFPSGSPLTLVFYARNTGVNVFLRHVKRQNRQISVVFEFIPDYTKTSKQPFALIPLGVLCPGIYSVTIEHVSLSNGKQQSPEMTKLLEQQRQRICQPFSFIVAPSEK